MQTDDTPQSDEERAGTAKLRLESLENYEQQLQHQLKEVTEKILNSSRRRRAFIRRQDASIGAFIANF
jgi:chaperonin cofactor prefoldin